MMRRTGDRFVIECDCCDAEVEGERGEPFQEFWPQACRDGWSAKKIGRDDWVHACPKHRV